MLVIEMEPKDYAGLLAGVALQPALFIIWSLLFPGGTPPTDTDRMIIQILAFISSSIMVLDPNRDGDLFWAGVGSYALADGLITAKLIATTAAIAVPR